MNCPKCVGILQKKEMESIEVDVCFSCEGIWFDAGELEAVLKADSRDVAFIDVGREDFDGAELKKTGIDLNSKKGKCPRCADGTMLIQCDNETNHKVRVDICPKGHGLWLDGGEIAQLRKRGLVHLREKVEFFTDYLKYAFSKEGFKDLTRKKRR